MRIWDQDDSTYRTGAYIGTGSVAKGLAIKKVIKKMKAPFHRVT